MASGIMGVVASGVKLCRLDDGMAASVYACGRGAYNGRPNLRRWRPL